VAFLTRIWKVEHLIITGTVLYGGHVCKSWQNIRLESGKEK
jgi:hypothetical protein